MGEDELMGGQNFIGALITMFVIFIVISGIMVSKK